MFKAVRRDGLTLQWCEKQTARLCQEAIAQNPWALEFVHDEYKTSELCLAAVKQCGFVVSFVQSPDEQLCLAAVRQSGYALSVIPEPSRTIFVYTTAIRRCGMTLALIPPRLQTASLCLMAVSHCGLSLQWANFRTPSICFEAVRQNAEALQYVPGHLQDHALCLMAVSRSGKMLQYVRKQTPMIVFEAIRYSPIALTFVDFAQPFCVIAALHALALMIKDFRVIDVSAGGMQNTPCGNDLHRFLTAQLRSHRSHLTGRQHERYTTAICEYLDLRIRVSRQSLVLAVRQLLIALTPCLVQMILQYSAGASISERYLLSISRSDEWVDPTLQRILDSPFWYVPGPITSWNHIFFMKPLRYSLIWRTEQSYDPENGWQIALRFSVRVDVVVNLSKFFERFLL